MQRIVGMGVVFGVGVAFGFVWGGWASVSVEPPPVPPQAFIVSSTAANLADPTYVGVRAGDILISVNGIKDATLFHALDAGLKRGNVCVTFERDSKVQEVCLGKPRAERLVAQEPVPIDRSPASQSPFEEDETPEGPESENARMPIRRR